MALIVINIESGTSSREIERSAQNVFVRTTFTGVSTFIVSQKDNTF